MGPLLACLVVLAVAIVESTGSGRFPLSAERAGATPPSTALGPVRVGGPDLAADQKPAGNAPRPALRSLVAPGGVPAASTGPVEGDTAGAKGPSSGGMDPAPACVHDDRPAPRAGLDQWPTTIVDTAFALPSGYRPRDLVPVTEAGLPGWGLVRSLVIDDLRALGAAARAAGNPIGVQSAYRSRERQADVFARWVASSGEAAARRFSARPGHSEHQLGTSLDLRAAAGGAPWTGDFGATAAGHWLAAHAPEFGFVQSYSAGTEVETCYGAEAWHVRYVGRGIAAEVAASGLPLRVWLWRFGADR